MKIKFRFIYLIIFSILIVVVVFFGNIIYLNSKISKIDIGRNTFKISSIVNIDENRVKYLDGTCIEDTLFNLIVEMDKKYILDIYKLGKTQIDLSKVIRIKEKEYTSSKNSLLQDNLFITPYVNINYRTFFSVNYLPSNNIENITFYFNRTNTRLFNNEHINHDKNKIKINYKGSNYLEIDVICSGLNIIFDNKTSSGFGQGNDLQNVIISLIKTRNNELYLIRCSSKNRNNSVSLSNLVSML